MKMSKLSSTTLKKRKKDRSKSTALQETDEKVIACEVDAKVSNDVSHKNEIVDAPEMPNTGEMVNTEDATKSKRKRKRKRRATDETSNTPILTDTTTNRSSSSILDRTVYVEGLPFDATEHQVRDWLIERAVAAGGGNSDNVILDLRLPTWNDTGRLRGYGHIEFSSVDLRTKALEEWNRQRMGSRYLTFQPAKAPKESFPTTQDEDAKQTILNSPAPDGCCVVFVKNVPYSATDEDLESVFGTFGTLREDGGGIRIARHSSSRQSKGFAYVEYTTPEDAQRAVQASYQNPQGIAILGRRVHLDYDTGRMKGSYKTEQGRLWTKEHGNNTTTVRTTSATAVSR
jgi:nucleolin